MSDISEKIIYNGCGGCSQHPQYSEIKNLSDYIKRALPNCVPIPLVKGTKQPFGGFQFAVNAISTEQMWSNWNTIGIHMVENGDADMALSIRGDMIVIAFDDEELGEQFVNCQDFANTACCKTAHGYHLYFTKTDACKDWVKMVRPYGAQFPMDIITTEANGTGALITIPPSTGKEWIRKLGDYDAIPMPDRYVEHHNESKVTKERKDEGCAEGGAVLDINSCTPIDTLQRIIDALMEYRADDYESWTRGVWAICNTARDNGYEEQASDLAHRFSKKCKRKYDPRAVNKLINARTFSATPLRVGTLLMWLKEDNAGAYEDIRRVVGKDYAFVDDPEVVSNDANDEVKIKYQQALSLTNYDVACVVYHKYKDEYVNIDGENGWYYFHNHRWHKDVKGTRLYQNLSTVADDIIKFATDMKNEMKQEAMKKTDEKERKEELEKVDETIKGYMGIVKKLKVTSFKNCVMKELAAMCVREGFHNKLDEQRHLIGFNNGVYDINTDTFRDGRKEDMLTRTTGYDFVREVDVGIRDRLMTFFRSIQKTEEMADYLLMSMAVQLHGDKKNQNVYIWTGWGGNGKGVVQRLWKLTLGDNDMNGYFYEIDISVYTKKKITSGAPSPELAKAKGARVMFSQEPEQSDTIQVGFCKAITGGDGISCRSLYENGSTFVLQAAPIISCNNKPHLSGYDGGVVRRLRVVSFPYNFRDTPNPNRENEKPIDYDLEECFKDVRFGQQLMLILIEKFKEYRAANYRIVVPQMVQEDTNEYILRGNYCQQFISDTYSVDDTESVVSTKEVYTEYKGWARENNLRAKSQIEFNEDMKREGYHSVHCTSRGLYHARKVFKGLKYRDTQPQQPEQQID